MKKFLLSTGFLLSFFIGFGQCPPNGDLILSSQADVDDFAISFPDCTNFSSTLTISGNDITDLSPLLQLISIGDLIIDNNPQLTSLIGLGNLENYTGENLIISNNPLLLSLDGLNGIGGEDAIDSVIEIVNNDSLINLEGLNGLVNTDFLVIEGNDALLNLTGLNNYLGSAVMTISNNTSLESFDGMNNFNGTTSLTIQDNPSLVDISSLSSNQFIEGFFIINNDSLTNINGLEVTNPFFGFRIVGNDALVNILALSNIQTPSSLIEVTENPNLSVCSIDTLCDNTTTETITINNNAPGCNSIEEVQETCVTCSLIDVTLTSQAEVDAFAVDFASCTETLNGLTISGDDIVDLSPLSVLSSISQELTIINNPQLTSIEGFDDVDFVEMVLTIENNATLLSIEGLSDTAIDGSQGVNQFIIRDNPSLMNLAGLNLLSSNAVQIIIENNDSLIDLSGLSINTNINNFVIVNNQNLINLSGIDILFDSFQVLEFEIRDNPNLTSLGIADLIEVGGFLIIKNNPSLVSLNLDTIGIVGLLSVDNNDSLENLEGLESLTISGIELFINDNENLTSLSGLSGLVEMPASMKISNNPNLISLNGLNTSISPTTFDIIIDANNSLQSLNGLQVVQTAVLLAITNNQQLNDLEGLNNLTYAETVSILDNDALPNLNGLENLGSGELESIILGIERNNSLIDISGISGLDLSELEALNIIDNIMLSECAIENICLFLNTNTNADNIFIGNNALGCNSEEEVQAVCNPCPILEEIILTTQAEVNDFVLNFSSCEVIQGTLRISGDDIVDLSPLSTVTTVGNLEIVDNTSLENLDGLALFSIGKTTPGIEPIFMISGNPSLTNLDGLSQLFEIEAKTFEISNNPLLTNLDVFSNVSIEIDFIDAILKIDNNASLVTMNGFDEIFSFSGDLTISNNPLLTSITNDLNLSVLQDVSIINNDNLLNLGSLSLLLESTLLHIEGNDSLQDLSGLEALESVESLEIVDNQLLEDLNELNGLSTIGSSISISNNLGLTSLQGLQGLFSFENTGGVLSITDNTNLSDISVLDFFSLFVPYEAIITGNTSLSSCDLNSFCEIIISNGEITIENNGTGCNSVEEVALNCDPCETLGLTLSSQAEVDSFPTVYGACLDGFVNVVISGSDIVDLTPLSSFTFVAGDLRIINNEQLTNLEGLNNLSSTIILEIGNNSQLSDITAISNALTNDTSIELTIRDNPLLETCNFEAMCEFLNTNIIDAIIENNAEGCATLEQVEENCLANLNLISGNIGFDFNTNGCDTNDYDAENILVQTTNGTETQMSITDEEGNFSFFVDEGIYTTSIISESLPIAFQGTPEMIESTFVGVGNEDAVSFCLEAIEIVNDIAVTLIPLQEPRPGFDARYIISYSNLGTTVESGTILMNFDNELLFYEDSSLLPFTINDTFIEWEYTEILPFETRSFEVGFEVFIPPTVQGGDILVSELEITTFLEDTNPENNVFVLDEVVVNSFDPNDKQVLQGERILEEEVGEYLDYIVRFQNTGTADAINVIVTDILSDNLNWNTLRILSSSDDYRVEITNGNEVAFIYENINLPPEEQDAEGSNGYIAFQIQSNDDLVLGDAIENTANIFFDFNAPIITNTVTTTVSEPCPEGDIILTSQAEVDAFAINYPNCTMISFPNNVTISGDDIIDLTPLLQITSIDDNLTIDNNPQLVSLAGLDNLVDIGNGLIVSNNPMLSSLNGPGAFGFTSVQIINNDNLVNLEGLNDLEEVLDGLIIEGNDALQNLVGLDNYFVGGSFIIRDNESLSSLEGVNTIFSAQTLIIEDNPMLTDISSLESLQEIVVLFEIINNDLLANLDGLENVSTPVGLAGFRISDNDALVDISALSDFETPTQFIEITNNSNLSDCVISLLCDNITNTDLVTINNNAPGCDTVEEVEEACILGVQEQFLENAITIYPNPTVDILNIAFTVGVQLENIDVFSVTGKKIVTTQDTSIDFSSLTRGVYFARIQTNQGTVIKKIVKK